LFAFAVGTSAADLIGEGQRLGTSVTSVTFLAVMLVLVVVLSIRQRRRPTAALPAAAE
jgi:uncharacterized membrane-anchored protein